MDYVGDRVDLLMMANLGLREGYIRRALLEGVPLSSLSMQEQLGAPDGCNHWWLRQGIRRLAHVWVGGDPEGPRLVLRHEWLQLRAGSEET